jgi:hypothetical protein
MPIMSNAKSSWFKWSMISVTFAMLAAFSIPMLGQVPPAVHVGNTQITGLPDDWSHHHVVFSNPGTEQEAIQRGRHDEWRKVVNDPRYVLQQLKKNLPVQGPAAVDAAYRAKWIAEATGVGNSALGTPEAVEPTIGLAGRTPRPISIRKKGLFSPSLKNDWSQTMGTGTHGTGGVYPAKYGFLSTQLSAYSCSDYVVFPTSVTGSSSVPNIIAFNELYTGCTTVPNQYWAVAITNGTTYGTVTTSPALSMDGEEVVFMETIGTSVYLVVVLMPNANDANVVSITCPSSTNVNNAAQGSSPVVWCAELNGITTDSHSSPFVDYTNNVLYVGDDSGVLHQYTSVFHSNGNHSVPSAGTSPWPVTVSSGNALSSPVFDSGTSRRIFVDSTSSSGNLYAYTTAGASAATSVGVSSTTSPGFFDAPIVDSTNEFVYTVTGDDPADSGHSAVYKFLAGGTLGGGSSIARFGTSTTTTMVYPGAFDATYYSGSGTTGYLWVCATQSSGATELQQISVPNLSVSASTSLTSAAATCSPVTEYSNSSDYIFMSVTGSGNLTGCSGSCVDSYVVSSGSAVFSHSLAATGGTSGIIIDNSASSPGSNIYYEDLGDTDAVQVSQSTL